MSYHGSHTTATIGCHVVAPSNTMDNRMGSIKNALEVNRFASNVTINDRVIRHVIKLM